MLDSSAVRTWKDTLVEATIPIEFFQMIAISPYFESVKIAIEAISNIFMLDVIKVSQEDKSSYWSLLVFVCGICYIWVFLVIFIIFDCEKISKVLAVIPRTF